MRTSVLLLITLGLVACDPFKDDRDGDGHLSAEAGGDDCDDINPLVNPSVEESCNGVDDNCDGSVDEGVTTTYYLDEDGDGFGDIDATVQACSLPEGAVPNARDCDDGSADSYPGAAEVCDEADNDCDGIVDDQPIDGETFFFDADGDGYGGTLTTTACEVPEGFVTNDEDCNDLDPGSNPSPETVEVCDGMDNDCDGIIPDDELDLDDDGIATCDGDCDDTVATTFPGAEETCNGVDDDCDGRLDEDATDAPTWYIDADSDGYGGDITMVTCLQPAGFVETTDDCDDVDATSYPGADEYCDEADNDCDGDVDEDALDAITTYADTDEDGYGDLGAADTSCDPPAGNVMNADDCDDTEVDINPDAVEVCDKVDNDCDGSTDFGLRVPSDYSDLQDALDAASDGERVCVAAGTYTGTFDFGTTEVMIESYDGSGRTTLDGDGDGPVVTIDGRQTKDTGLIGVTLANGDASRGAGLLLRDSYAMLRDVELSDNSCDAGTCDGVAIYVEDAPSNLDWEEIVIDGATCTAASCNGTALHLEDTDLRIDDLTVQDVTNTLDTCSGDISGGVARLEDGRSALTVVGGTIERVKNELGSPGSTCSYRRWNQWGGLFRLAQDADMDLDDVLIDDVDMVAATAGTSGTLDVYDYGTVIRTDRDNELTLTDVTVTDIDIDAAWRSSSPSRRRWSYGGVVYLGHQSDLDATGFTVNDVVDRSFRHYAAVLRTESYADVDIEDFTFDNINVSTYDDLYGGLIWTNSYSSLRLVDGTLDDNTLVSTNDRVYGGVMYLDSYGSNELEDVSISDNTVRGRNYMYGGVIRDQRGSTTLTNVDIGGNTVSATLGWIYGGLYWADDGSLEFQNVDMRGNTVTSYYDVYGGMTWLDDISPTWTNVIQAGNRTTSSYRYVYGALNYMQGGTLDIENASLTGNDWYAYYWTYGGAFYANCDSRNRLELTNTDISYNYRRRGSGRGGVFYRTCTSVGYSFDHSNYYSVSDGLYNASWSGTNLLTTTPGYTSRSGAASTWDLSLASGSNLIDKGNNSIKDDDGTRSDVGAYGGPGGADW